MLTVYLQIENLFSPASKVQNSIGFETLPTGYTTGGVAPPFPLFYTLTGTMNIGMTNVFLQSEFGLWLPLLGFDAGSVGNISTNGSNVTVTYQLGPP